MFNKIKAFTNNLRARTDTMIILGRDVLIYGTEKLLEQLKKKDDGIEEKKEVEVDDSITIEMKRHNLQKNFTIPEADDAIAQAQQQSLKSSQGMPDHSGSSYHGPGRPGEKINANMAQRNFENHQGN
jgi:hypothetical protein